ncbi:MAG TPA: hypothetical protein VF011_22045 [Terriglobales bacterium]
MNRCSSCRHFERNGDFAPITRKRKYHVPMNRARTAFLSVVLVAGFWVALNDQQALPHQRRASTFASPDGAFRFEYSRSLVSCARSPNHADWWVPDDACNAFTPVCSNFSCDSSGTVACIAYPSSEMKGTSFQAAAFSVNELKNATTETECLTVEEPPPHVGKAQNETIDGVKFTVTETDGVETGNLIDGYVYRTFHQAKCYELDIRIAYSNPAYADPGTMKDFDLNVVHRDLKRVLDTFVFLK